MRRHEHPKTRGERIRRWLPIAPGVLALCLGGGGHASELRDRLTRLRTEIQRHQDLARTYKDEAAELLAASKAVEQELADLRQPQRSGGELTTARGSLARARSDLAQAKSRVADRLVAIYKFGATGGMPALYSARDFQTVIRLGEDLSRVIQGDLRAFARVREARQVSSESEERVRALEAQIAIRERAAEQNLATRLDEEAAFRSRAKREAVIVSRLESVERELERLERSESRRAEAGPGLRRGRLPVPVDGDIRTRFGDALDPELDFELTRVGIEFAAERGAQVRAVGSGRVLYASWLRGYGQVVVIDHGQGTVTISGYLEDVPVQAGDALQTGDVIGSVGQGPTEEPGLYFALSRDGKLIDPSRWFR